MLQWKKKNVITDVGLCMSVMNLTSAAILNLPAKVSDTDWEAVPTSLVAKHV